METKKKKIVVYKKSIRGYKEIDVYVTKDGQEFGNQKLAARHEAQLEYAEMFNKIKQFSHPGKLRDILPDITWFFPENEEEIKMIMNWADRKRSNLYVNGKRARTLPVGEWITYFDYEFYTLNYFKDQYAKYFSLFDDKEGEQ